MRKSRSLSIPLVALAAMLIIVACGSGRTDRATISEKKEIIGTYPFSDPDPVPILARKGQGTRLYPYFAFDGFTKTVARSLP